MPDREPADPHLPRRARPLPAMARYAFTAWIVAWVPVVVLVHGPQNFLWLCNIAQFVILCAVWRPSPVLVASQAGTVVLIGLIWTADFAVGLVAGGSLTGITAYMFNPDIALIGRAVSLYHVWLPLFVIWLCLRQGYDGRGPWLQCLIATLAILAAALWSAPERNINFAFAPFGIEQDWLPQLLYLPLLAVATMLLVILPGHWLVRAILAYLRLRRAD